MKQLVVVLVSILHLVPLMADLSLLILHTNDMHGKFEETARNSGTCFEGDRKAGKCFGGFGRLAHEIRKYRQLAENDPVGRKVLFLNAGDTYTGSVWFSLHKWRIAADFINILKPDAVSLGNHEFDYGISELVPYLEAISVPVVTTNIDTSKEPQLSMVKKSIVLDYDGVKVGILGYIIKDTKILASTGNVTFSDEIEAIREESERLDRYGVKIIIALGHAGFVKDQQIAAEVPLVDVVVGAHSHTFLYTGKAPDIETPEDVYPKVITQPSGKKVPVVQAYAYTKYLGRLNVTFDDLGNLKHFSGAPELLTSDIPQDEDVLSLLDSYRPKVNELYGKVVGKTAVDWDSSTCRLRECTTGNIIADAFVLYVADKAKTDYWTTHPISLINGGNIRNSVSVMSTQGVMSLGILKEVSPFENLLSTCYLTGRDLLQAIETGVRSNGETSKGEFLQFSGVKVVFNVSNPVGKRVVDVKIRCGNCTVPSYEDLDLNAKYGIVVNDFILGGGDGFSVLKNKCVDKKVFYQAAEANITTWYLQHYSPGFTEIQGRIKFVDSTRISSKASSCTAGFIHVALLLILVSRFR